MASPSQPSPANPSSRFLAWLRAKYWRSALAVAVGFGLLAAALQMIGLLGGEDLSGRQIYWLGVLTFIVAFLAVAIIAWLVSILRRLTARR